jgi:NADPH-dependent 2,4-dienoyl-CoA reductase/sulfur reductase-like enzyme
MTKTNILVIGGGPAGVIAAVTAKKNNPARKVVLVRENKTSVIPCGIPYVFNRLNSVKKDILPDKSLLANKIAIVIDKALSIDTLKRIVTLASKKRIQYSKLIIATGSEPIKIPIIGIDKKEVWQIRKDFEYLKKLRRAVLAAKKIVIIGGGYIGVELAEELSSMSGKKITIVEKLDHCLGTTMDKEFTKAAEDRLIKKGVIIHTRVEVKEIGGKDAARYVRLKNHKKILTDLVIVSVGAKPRVDVINGTNIKKGMYGAIWVSPYMKTNIKDIFAVGDCAETRDFFTGKGKLIMLASTACYEARVAGMNIYGKSKMIKNNGTLACFSTSVDGLMLGSVGLNEKSAHQKTVVGTSQCPSHHPGSLPDTHLITVKLIFSKPEGLLLGGQVMGPESAGEIVNIIALAIQKRATVHELSTLQVATHPLLTPSPTAYPLITAAQLALSGL